LKDSRSRSGRHRREGEQPTKKPAAGRAGRAGRAGSAVGATNLPSTTGIAGTPSAVKKPSATRAARPTRAPENSLRLAEVEVDYVTTERDGFGFHSQSTAHALTHPHT